jgi:prolyl-tRNA synthetase
MSKSVTPQSENYNTWYTDVVTKADLADYGPVKGTMVVKPYGFAMWDLIKETFDKMIKDTGHVNAYFQQKKLNMLKALLKNVLLLHIPD